MDGAQGGDRPERPALVTALELDNDVLSARIAARACPARSRTMRYACGWFVRTSLMCAALLAILYGYRYAEAHCDYLVQNHVRVLCEDNARLKRELSRETLAERARFTGRTMTAFLWVFALTLGALYWQWNNNERSYHAGFGAGYAEAFGVKRDGAGGSSTVSSPVATPPTTPGDATGSPMPETGENPPTKTIEYKNGVLTTTTWPVPGFSPPTTPRGGARH